MHLTQLKTASELKLNGVTVEFTTAGNDVREVILSCEGQRYIIQQAGTYSNDLRVFRADKFKKEKRHVIEGEIFGLKVNEAFESSYDANARLNDLKSKDDGASLALTEKEVPVNASTGQIAADDKVPF